MMYNPCNNTEANEAMCQPQPMAPEPQYYPQADPFYYQQPPSQPMPQYYQPPPPPMPMPPPPPQGAAPTVITINHNSDSNDSNATMCPNCCCRTPTFSKRTCGAGNLLHCCIWSLCFGPLALIFLCSEDSMDI